MIGKEIRSIRHLAKESGTSLRSAIINFNQYGTSYCRVFVTKEGHLFIFNNQYNYGCFRLSSVLSSPDFDKCREELSIRYGRLVGVTKEEFNSHELSSVINGITLLPETFETDYTNFFSENHKAINPLIHKYGFSLDDSHIKRIFAYTGNSKNFFVWAINANYNCGVTINAIKRILWWNENYKQLVKNLSKGTITAYTTYKDIVKLFSEISELRKEKRINDSINMFNTTQKKILRSMEFTEEDKKVISSFYRLSESKKINFVKKASTIEDGAELMRQMRHVTSTHFSWNKESFMDFVDNVENINYEKIFEKDDVVLVKVKDFETVKHLAKTTNWCISKNKSYWNNYVENVRNAEQYILFDFSQKEDALTSIVGFTSRYNKGITNAHDFINNNMMDNGGVYAKSLINSYVSHLRNNSGIYSFLEKHGIDINMVAKYEKPLYEWDKESMYKYLYECVDKNNVQVLSDNGEYVVISVNDSNIKYFLGDTYMDNINTDFNPLQHIIFMNFSMNQYDPNRLLFAIIQNGRNGEEDYCVMFKNEHCVDSSSSFEMKLSQFGLPYDTIKRVDDCYVRLRDAIQSFNSPEVMKGMKNEDIFREVIYDYIGDGNMADYIKKSIIEFVSFDYLDVFYNNGHKISDFISVSNVNNLLNSVLCMFINLHPGNRVCPIPSQKDIDRFFNREIDDIHEATKIGIFLALDKMLVKENTNAKDNERMYKPMLGTIISSGCKGGAIDHFINFMLDNFDFTKKSDCMTLIYGYVSSRGGAKIKEKLESLKDKSKYLTEKFSETPQSTSSVFDEEIFDMPDFREPENMENPELEGDDAFEENEAFEEEFAI